MNRTTTTNRKLQSASTTIYYSFLLLIVTTSSSIHTPLSASALLTTSSTISSWAPSASSPLSVAFGRRRLYPTIAIGTRTTDHQQRIIGSRSSNKSSLSANTAVDELGGVAAFEHWFQSETASTKTTDDKKKQNIQQRWWSWR